jgi:hypothetical protein
MPNVYHQLLCLRTRLHHLQGKVTIPLLALPQVISPPLNPLHLSSYYIILLSMTAKIILILSHNQRATPYL